MESLSAYGSDDECQDSDSKTPRRRQAAQGGQTAQAEPHSSRRDDDTNYDHVTMDMSEESNNNNSDYESPNHEIYRRSSHSSGERDYNSGGLSPSERNRSETEQNCPDDKYNRNCKRNSPKSVPRSHGITENYSDDSNKNRSHNSVSQNQHENRQNSTEYENSNDTHKYVDECNTDNSRRYDRNNFDKRNREHDKKEKDEKERRYNSDRHNVCNSEKYDKKHSTDDRRSYNDRKRERSRSRDKSYSSHRKRTPSNDRDKHGRIHSHRHSEGSKRSNSRERRSYRRSRSKSPVSNSEYKPSYKVSKKLQAMDKMGLQIKTPDGSMATAQMLLQQTFAEQVEKVKNATGIELPKYYNPAAMNPLKYANQIQKRKLLWGNKSKEGSSMETSYNESSAGCNIQSQTTANKWQGTKFAQDSDGKVASKFMRLMGIKDPSAAQSQTSTSTGTGDIVKKQEEMFEAMQAQYEVARATTHTMRGVGLGFSSHNKNF